MKEQILISIPQPCQEQWDQMTPVEQGRHCAVCQKNVVDFTNESDDSLIDFFKNYNGSTCGRFTRDQLNRPLQKIELKSASEFLKYAAGLLLPAMITGIKVNAQTAHKKSKELHEIVITGQKRMIGKIVTVAPVPASVSKNAKDTFSIRPLKPLAPEHILSGKMGGIQIMRSFTYQGLVIDEKDGTPLANATVHLKGENQATLTDTQGRFSVTSASSGITVIISYVGYEQKEVLLQNTITQTKINLIPVTRELAGEVIVVSNVKKAKKITTGTSAVKVSSKRGITSSILNILSPHKISVYPNPVSTSQTLTIGFKNTKPGLYQIRLISSSGQLFYSFQKQLSASSETAQIHLNKNMNPGTYLLQIIDERNKMIHTSKVMIH